MTLALDTDTTEHLDRALTQVERDFSRLDAGLVHERFDAIVAQILEDATIADYVPVLAVRYTREGLRNAT